MSLKTFTPEEKLGLLRVLIQDQIKAHGRYHPRCKMLKAIAQDFEARAALPKSNMLGEIERAIMKVEESKSEHGTYAINRLVTLSTKVIQFWPMLRQAMEQFGELSAE